MNFRGNLRPFTYRVWSYIKVRCYNKNYEMYKYYGGRGIKVCKRWFKYKNFLEDMGVAPGPNYTLERIDPNSDYKKSNCIWISWHFQRRSRTDSRFIKLQRYKFIETDWAYALGFSKGGSVQRRLDRGWPIVKALTTDNRGNKVSLKSVVKKIKYNLKNEIYYCRHTKTFKSYKDKSIRGLNHDK